MAFQIKLAKESAKFSSTHFTVFGPTEAERLHGHNYQIEVQVDVPEIGDLDFAFDFNDLKPHIKAVADELDEKVLIAELNPHITISSEAIAGVPHTTVKFSNRSYRFPTSEVVALKIRNVTSEALARWIAQDLKRRASSCLELSRASSIAVMITETSGQSARFIDRIEVVK